MRGNFADFSRVSQLNKYAILTINSGKKKSYGFLAEAITGICLTMNIIV